MKKTIKQRLIKLLQQGEVSTFNRYRRLTHNTFIDLAGANLTGADLRRANLTDANLAWTDLAGANLTGADLRRADLTDAKLTWTDLAGANLAGANLTGADLDYSVLFLGCPSLLPKTDEKQRTQLCFHFLSWIKNSENATDFEKELYSFALDYANKFHRADVERLEEMK